MHVRRRPVLVALSLLAFSAATVTPAISNSAQAAAQGPPVAVQGTLQVAGHGAGASATAPSLRGVRVALYAMPTQPFMNKLRPGDRVQGKLVGVTTSAANGAYSIKVTHPAAIRSSAFDGIVNFEIWAAGHGYWTVYGYSRMLTAGNALVPMFGPATTAPEQAALTMYRVNKHDAAIPATSAGSGCWVLAPNGDLGPVEAKLQGLWSNIRGVKKDLSYTTGATSSVSIGVSIDGGKWGSGHDGHTTDTETSGGQDFPTLKGTNNKVGETEMEEGLFNTCEISGEVGTFPYAVDGGTAWAKSKPPKARFCVKELAGSKLHMDRTASFTFDSGVDLQDIFGIYLSASTGYSHSASIKYTYTTKGYACGTHSYPLRASDIAHGVVADSTVHGNA